MPLKLVPPRQGWSPYWTVRGTYLGQYVNRSSKARGRALAGRVLRETEREIERGAFANKDGPTFAGAAADYMKAGGERRFLAPLIRHFRLMPLPDIDQASVDKAAFDLYPKASPATRNRQVYSPISAVLRRAGVTIALKRPKGAQGRQLTHWLTPKEAFRIFTQADRIDKEFGLLLRMCCYTGARLSEVLRIECRDIEGEIVNVGRTKSGQPRGAYLPPMLVKALKKHPRGIKREGRLFRFTKSGALYLMHARACAQAGVSLPERVAFHVWSHTWATWMRKSGGLDTRGLVGTGRWSDQKSAARYTHVVVSDESRRAGKLPVPRRG